jgi:hypothetical protein
MLIFYYYNFLFSFIFNISVFIQEGTIYIYIIIIYIYFRFEYYSVFVVVLLSVNLDEYIIFIKKEISKTTQNNKYKIEQQQNICRSQQLFKIYMCIKWRANIYFFYYYNISLDLYKNREE